MLVADVVHLSVVVKFVVFFFEVYPIMCHVDL